MIKTLSVLILLIFSTSALACSCIQPPPVANRMDSSSATFVGRVLSEDLQGDTRTYTFEVVQAFKGKLPSHVVVTTHLDGAACGSKFSLDKNYLVFASGSVPDAMATSLCFGNRDAASAIGKLELLELKKMKNEPNNAMQPTPLLVTDRAYARSAPRIGAADL